MASDIEMSWALRSVNEVDFTGEPKDFLDCLDLAAPLERAGLTVGLESDRRPDSLDFDLAFGLLLMLGTPEAECANARSSLWRKRLSAYFCHRNCLISSSFECFAFDSGVDFITLDEAFWSGLSVRKLEYVPIANFSKVPVKTKRRNI